MSQSAGTIYSEIRIALDKLEKDVTQVGAQFNRIEGKANATTNQTTNKFDVMGKNVGKAFQGMSNSGVSKFAGMLTGMQKALMAVPIVGAVMLIVGSVKRLFTQVSTFLNDSTNAWIQHRQEIAKVDTVLNNTGASAWTSTRQLRDMALGIADATGHSANEVMRLQSVILSFRSITGEAFERTTKLAANMAAVMGGDLAGAGKNLARALEDPVQGIRALARYGFVLDSATQSNIKSLMEQGKTLEAHDLVLTKIEGSFRDIAAVMNTVNAAQSDLDTANERIAIAAGEATSGWTLFWRRQRANARMATADMLEFRNAIARAESADYSEHIQRIEMLRQSVSNAADEVERLMPEHLLIMAELHLDYDTYNDQLILIQRELNNLNTAIASNRGTATRAQEEQRRSLEALIATQKERINTIRGEISTRQTWAAERQRQLTMEEAELEKVVEMESRLLEIEQRRVDTLREIERAHRAGMITQDEVQVRTMAAYQSEATAINQLMSMSTRLNLSTAAGIRQQEELMNSLASGMNRAATEYNRLGEEIRLTGERLTPQQLADFVTAQLRSLNLAMTTLRSRRDSDLRETENFNNAVLALYRSTWNTINNFAGQHGVDWGLNQLTRQRIEGVIGNIEELEAGIEAAAEAQRIYNEQARAMERLPMVYQDIRDQIVRQTGSLEEIMEMERKRAWRQIFYSEDYQALLRSEAKEHENLRNQIAEAFNELWNLSEERSPWQNFLSGAQQYSQQIVGILNAGMQLYSNSVRRETDILRRELDQRHRLLRESLERDMQARLHAKGLIEAATETQHERELELAIKTGDHRKILLAKNNLERFRIEDEFAQKKAELDEKMAKERAKLDYRAAVAAHRAQVVSSMASAAQAVLMAGMNKWPLPAIPMMALASSKSALQLAAVRAARPQLQAFDSGGIVPGHSFRGDRILARVNSGEMILNAEQQRRLFELANSFNADDPTQNSQKNRPIQINTVIELDGKEIAKKTFQLASLGNVFIRARGIVR